MKITKDLYKSLFENTFSTYLDSIAKENSNLIDFFLKIDDFDNINQHGDAFEFELTFQSNGSTEIFLRNLSGYTRQRIERFKQNNRYGFYLNVENANINLLKKDLISALKRYIDYIQFLSVENGYIYLHADKVATNLKWGIHDN